MTNEQNGAFEPLDFAELQRLAQEGQLDALVAFTADGQIIAYAAQEGAQTKGPAGGHKTARRVQYAYASSSYYYCNTDTDTWWYCYIDASGNENCRDTGRPC